MLQMNVHLFDKTIQCRRYSSFVSICCHHLYLTVWLSYEKNVDPVVPGMYKPASFFLPESVLL